MVQSAWGRTARTGLLVALFALLLSPSAGSIADLIDADRTAAIEALKVPAGPDPAVDPGAPMREPAAPDDHSDVIVRPGPELQWIPVSDDDNAHEPPMEFQCYEAGIIEQSQGIGTDRVTYSCPYRIYDANYNFGSPALAVHPNDPGQVVFTSLHGPPVAPEENPPTERSRRGTERFTAFASDNHGLRWRDNFLCCNLPSDNALGEHSSVTMDSEGHIYIGYLFSLHDGGREVIGDRTGSLIGLYKGGTVEQDLTPSYGNAFYVANRSTNGLIREVHLVRLAVPSEEPREVANETADDNRTYAGQAGEPAFDEIPLDETIAAVWGETTDNKTTAPNGWYGWIDAAWTHTGTAKEWTRLEDSELIGPCQDFSNAATYKGNIYVACVVAKGYNARPRAYVGDVDIWRISTTTGKSHFVSHSGLTDGTPRLAMTEDGYTFLANYEFRDPLFFGSIAYGWRGAYWTAENNDIGTRFNRWASSSAPIKDAHITAVGVTQDARTAFVVYQEWLNKTGNPLDDQAIGANPRLTDYKKILIAFNECDGALAYVPMELGFGMDPHNFEAYTENPATFNDIQDGLQVTTTPSGRQVLTFAINDYGVMQYGNVVPYFEGSECQPPAPPPPLPLVGALATPAGTGVSTVMGSTFGVASAVVVGYLLTVKRRTPNWTTVEDDR